MATQKIPGRAIKLGTDTAGDVAYFDGAAWQRLAIGESGEVLTMNEAGTFPSWGTAWQFQGDYNGYIMGGNTNIGPGHVNYDVIERNSFSTDTNSVDVGDLVFARTGCIPCLKSMTHGYAAGGTSGAATYYNQIEKFQFAASANAVDTADLTATWAYGGGHSSSLNCYMAGGAISGARTDTINKFVKATEVNATDIANLTTATGSPFSSSSTDHGYIAGGTGAGSPAQTDTIQRFTFATDTDATDVGNLNTATWAGSSSSSLTHGYIAGGYGHGTLTSNRIEKYSFAASGNATQIGTLTGGRGNETLGGTSSTTHGYAAGGITSLPSNVSNVIDKYSFTTDGNASDVGDLTVPKTNLAGTQN